MNLNKEKKEIVLKSVQEQYSLLAPGLTVSDAVDLNLDNKSYQVFSVVNDKVKVLFVIFDATEGYIETIVSRLIQQHKYHIGHGVTYQFLGEDFQGTVLSTEINNRL